MSETCSLVIDGARITVPRGITVAAAVLLSGSSGLRTSVTGEPRGPLCGMGICLECRVTIGGLPHQRSCQILCEDGMDIRTRV